MPRWLLLPLATVSLAAPVAHAAEPHEVGAAARAESGSSAVAPAGARPGDAPASASVSPAAEGASSGAQPAAPMAQPKPVAPLAAAQPVLSPGPDDVPLPARDTVGGHFSIGVAGGLLVPFGSIERDVPQGDILDAGYAIGGDVTYGVSRTLGLGLAAQGGFLTGAGSLDGAAVSGAVIGPLVRYHLVQGTRFDPWMSFGVAYRSTSTEAATLTGIDWARIQLGGEWYPGSQLGFGPLLELSLGTFFDSTAELGDSAVNAHFLLGGRLVFDTPGK